MPRSKIIELDICNEYFYYDDEGFLYWKKLYSENCRNGLAVVGQRAGNLCKRTGYYNVKLGGLMYRQHRLLYQMYHNITLTEYVQIDHIDMNRSNNKKENLRCCSQSENQCNRTCTKLNKSTGIKNIYRRIVKGKQYLTIQISKNDKIVYNRRFLESTISLDYIIKLRDDLLIKYHGDYHNLM